MSSTRRHLLAGGAAALPVASVAALPIDAQADAELLALAAEVEAVHAEQERLSEPYRELVGAWPADVRARLFALTDQYHDLVDRLYPILATTLPGLRAKARLAMEIMDQTQDDGPFDPDERLSWSLARDVLALAGGAA